MDGFGQHYERVFRQVFIAVLALLALAMGAGYWLGKSFPDCNPVQAEKTR